MVEIIYDEVMSARAAPNDQASCINVVPLRREKQPFSTSHGLICSLSCSTESLKNLEWCLLQYLKRGISHLRILGHECVVLKLSFRTFLISLTFILFAEFGIHVNSELFFEVLDGKLSISHILSIDSDPWGFAFFALCIFKLFNVPGMIQLVWIANIYLI